MGIAAATRDKRRVGRIHRNKSGHEPTARRNRMRLWAACGVRIDHAFPFEADLSDPASLCLRCYPEARPYP